jgi:hypothetical protein
MFGGIQRWYDNNKGKWWLLLIIFFAGVTAQALIGNRIFPPKPARPDIKIVYNYVRTIAHKPDTSGDIRIDYESDKNITAMQLFIRNKGSDKAKNFEFKICTRSKEIEVNPATILYIPTLLKGHVIKSEDFNNGKNGCYRKIDVFPPDSRIYVEVFPKLNIQKDDIDLEFLSELQTWRPIEGQIDYTQKRGFFGEVSFRGEAFAGDEKNKERESPPKGASGILIGGYDPVIMTNNLFALLQEKHLISKSDARKIKDITEATKMGVLFGGVNILKFNEAVLNALIRNDKLTKVEASKIVEKSKDAGGVLVGGYNIIVLEVGIMNSLVKKGYIDLEKAQLAVDSAKPGSPAYMQKFEPQT